MNMWEYNKRSNFCAIEVPDREEKTGGVEKVTEKIWVEKTPKFGKTCKYTNSRNQIN